MHAHARKSFFLLPFAVPLLREPGYAMRRSKIEEGSNDNNNDDDDDDYHHDHDHNNNDEK